MNGVDYNFLREDKRLGKRIEYLTYGTNNANSDINVRGFDVESISTLLTGKNFEQVEDLKRKSHFKFNSINDSCFSTRICVEKFVDKI